MDTHDYVTYQEWGRNFFEVAVTEERVAAAFAEIAGDEFEMGPMSQGPGRIAKVTAKVRIQKPQARRTLGDTITFAIHIPLEIDLLIDLLIDDLIHHLIHHSVRTLRWVYHGAGIPRASL